MTEPAVIEQHEALEALADAIDSVITRRRYDPDVARHARIVLAEPTLRPPTFRPLARIGWRP